MKYPLLLLFAMVSILSIGCSSLVPHDLDTTKPIEINEGFFGFPLKQEGNTVDVFDARDKFAAIPEARAAAHASSVYQWTGVGTSVIGAYFIVSAIEEQFRTPLDNGLAIAFIVADGILGELNRSALREAARAYNGRLAKSTSASLQLKPFFAPLVSQRASGAVAGLNLNF